MTNWYDENGNPVAIGETVTNFRGETGTLEGTGRDSTNALFPPKVLVNGREYNASVWRLHER